jgi:hypothetical protein
MKTSAEQKGGGETLTDRLSFVVESQGKQIKQLQAKVSQVSNYLWDLMDGQVGVGDDPVGFLIASHAAIVQDNKELRAKLEPAQKALGIGLQLAEWKRSHAQTKAGSKSAALDKEAIKEALAQIDAGQKGGK